MGVALGFVAAGLAVAPGPVGEAGLATGFGKVLPPNVRVLSLSPSLSRPIGWARKNPPQSAARSMGP